MKRIVEIVPARPGWYARWQPSPDVTRSYPVTIWALIEDTEAARREVIGVDSVGQWPGADDNETSGEFVRYLFQPPEAGRPEDAEQDDGATGRSEGGEPGPGEIPSAPRLQPVSAT